MEKAINEIAPLRNIELMAKLGEELQKRPVHLPGIGVFSGFSGYGKSFAAASYNIRTGCPYVEVRATWRISTLFDKILASLGKADFRGTIADKEEAVIEALIENGKPLIIDEFDHLVNMKNPRYLEIVRGLHDASNVPLIIIGEELLPKKLEKVERFHNRVLSWVKAEAVNLEDAKVLVKLSCPNLIIENDLLERIVKLSQGKVRRVTTNLYLIREKAKLERWKEVDAKLWGKRELYTGNTPDIRRI